MLKESLSVETEMKRPYNFSPGPAMLPETVLKKVQQELLDWHGCGMSVMELPHRGADFLSIAEKTEQSLRELMGISADYHILFLQGGARSQFAMVPLNLAGENNKAAYLTTGIWSRMARDEAKRFCDVVEVASSEASNFVSIPERDSWQIPSDAAYLHYADNETINGLEFPTVPNVAQDIPLVSDMSSSILSRPIDVNRFGVIYASAQKNIGPAGVTLVIVRKDLLERSAKVGTPSMFDYRLHVKGKSMQNTPPTFAWYVSGLVFDWIKEQGGLAAMAELNQQKADLLYRYLDETDFYQNPVDPRYRSVMNVVFTLPSDELTQRFLAEATAVGLTNLKGHRLVGGVRASIYNPMPLAGVKTLVDFMRAFEKNS